MFDLIDQPMRVKYYFNGRVTDAGPAKFDEEWFDRWLASMVNETDVIIFFLTVETTDVFEKEWDFNDVPGQTFFYSSHGPDPIFATPLEGE